MAKAKRPALYRYPGELGKVTDPSRFAYELFEKGREFARSNPDAPASEISAHKASVTQEVANRHRHQVLLRLMEHFGIDPSNSVAFHLLAAHLANKHVPAFQIAVRPRRGRPKSRGVSGNRLLAMLGEAPKGRSWSPTRNRLSSDYQPTKREMQRQRSRANDEAIEEDFIRGASSLEAKGKVYTVEAAFKEAARLAGSSSWKATSIARTKAKQWSKVRRRQRSRLAAVEAEVARLEAETRVLRSPK